MGNQCLKPSRNDQPIGRQGKKDPIYLNMGGQSMSVGFSKDEVNPPENVNTDPAFVAAKEEQYAKCIEYINQEIATD